MTILTKNHQTLTAEVNRHIEADSVAQGSYNTCFIGCLAHQQDDPNYIKDTYGIPVMLTRILEAIFENLGPDEAVDFFGAFPAAVGKNDKDLTKVSWKFLVGILKNLPEQPAEIQEVIDPVITGLSLLAEGKEWATDDALDAAEAARAAARAAEAAAYWASQAAEAAAYWASQAAAWAARAAETAALAAEAAADATYAAARAAALAGVSYQWQRDLILRLIDEA
jgi:hypothetical protein